MQGRIQGGGLRVLKHPPKLPKVNYLLCDTVNLLSEFRCYQLSNSIIQQLCLLMKLKSQSYKLDAALSASS